MTKCRFAISAPGEPQLSPYAATVNDGEMVNRVGLSRKHIFDAAKASVQRLGTYIDVLQIQRMDLRAESLDTRLCCAKRS